MLAKITHIIFDLDGTLITLPDNKLVILENALRNCGVSQSFSEELKLKIPKIGNLKQVYDEISKELSEPIERDVFENAAFAEYNKVKKDCRLELMPGAERLVKHFHNHQIPMAIATSNVESSYLKSTSNFGDFFTIGKYFNHRVLTTDPEVTKEKPDPQIYSVCAKRFNPQPLSFENVLIFEDFEENIDGIIDIGMQCCLVPYDKEARNERATIIIDSLNDFQPQLFGLPPFE